MRPVLFLDLLVALILLFGLWRGYRSGLVGGVLRLAGIVMGIWLSPVLVSMAEPWLPEILFEPLPRLVLYILSFALVTGSFVVLSKLLDRLIGDTPLGWADHLVGALAGLLISVLVISVLLNLIHLAGLYEAISPEMSDRELLIYDLLRVPAPALFHHFRDTLPSLPDGLPRGGA